MPSNLPPGCTNADVDPEIRVGHNVNELAKRAAEIGRLRDGLTRIVNYTRGFTGCGEECDYMAQIAQETLDHKPE